MIRAWIASRAAAHRVRSPGRPRWRAIRIIRSMATQHMRRETVWGRTSSRISHMPASSRSQLSSSHSSRRVRSAQASTLSPAPYLLKR